MLTIFSTDGALWLATQVPRLLTEQCHVVLSLCLSVIPEWAPHSVLFTSQTFSKSSSDADCSERLRYLLVGSLLLSLLFLEDVLHIFRTPGWAQQMVHWGKPFHHVKAGWVWWCMSVIPELFVGQTKTGGSGSSWDNQSSWIDESQAQWKTLNQELRGRVIKEDIWNLSSVFTCTYTRVHMCTYTCKHIPIPHTWTYTYKPCPSGPIRHWMTKKVAGHCASTGFQELLSTNRKKVAQNWDFPGTDTIFYPVLKVWSYLDIIVHKRWMSFIHTLSYF